MAQHAEEAAFSWLLRSDAVSAPHYSLHDLATLDGRLDAHLDGLQIAGEAGWELVRGELAWQEPGEAFVAGVLAFESRESFRIDDVLDATLAEPALVPGVISALGWLDPEVATQYCEILVRSANPVVRRIGVGGLAVHRTDPGRALTGWSIDDDPGVRARALKAIGELGRADLVSVCTNALQDDDAACRFRAAWSGAMLGDEFALHSLVGCLSDGEPARADVVCRLAARRLPAQQAFAWQSRLAEDAELLRYAVIAAGGIGDPALAPWLIEVMAYDAWARPAGEAFRTITGVDLAFENLERDAPEDEETGPTDDPADENVALDPDEDLPFPHPGLVQQWWSTNGSRFQPGVRYLAGQPISADASWQVLRTGMQRHRAAAAMELARLSPGAPLFEVRARGDRQRRALGV